MQEVTGSIPVFSTNLNTPQKMLCGVFLFICKNTPGRFARRDIAYSLCQWLQPWLTVKKTMNPSILNSSKNKTNTLSAESSKTVCSFFA